MVQSGSPRSNRGLLTCAGNELNCLGSRHFGTRKGFGMADSPKKRSLGKKLLIAVGVLFVLLVVAYFVGTSTAFLKGVILPRVSKSVGADITVTDASISPFSRVELVN